MPGRCPPSPGFAPCAILIWISFALTRYALVTPNLPDATCLIAEHFSESNLSGSSPPSPELDFPPSLFIAIAIHSCASFEIEPYDIAPVLNLLTISEALSTSSSGIPPFLSYSKSRSPLKLRSFLSSLINAEYSLNFSYEPECVASRRAIIVFGLYICSSASSPLLSLCSPILSSVSSTCSPSGSNAWLCLYSTSSEISDNPIPSTGETVFVKYLSITDFEIPTASKICADWYD